MAMFSLCLLHAVLQRILGVDVRWHHIDRIPRQRHVLVSNHLTAGDLMMLYSLPHHYVHLISAKLPKRISQVCRWEHRKGLPPVLNLADCRAQAWNSSQ